MRAVWRAVDNAALTVGDWLEALGWRVLALVMRVSHPYGSILTIERADGTRFDVAMNPRNAESIHAFLDEVRQNGGKHVVGSRKA